MSMARRGGRSNPTQTAHPKGREQPASPSTREIGMEVEPVCPTGRKRIILSGVASTNRNTDCPTTKKMVEILTKPYVGQGSMPPQGAEAITL